MSKVYGEYLPIDEDIQIMVLERIFKFLNGNDFKKVLNIVNRDFEEMKLNKLLNL